MSMMDPNVSVGRFLSQIDIGEGLAVSVTDFKATGYRLDGPWCRKSSFGHSSIL